MFLRNWLLFMLVVVLCNTSFAQANPENQIRGNIRGEIHDANANVPIEYANLILYTMKDSTQVTGTVSDKTGKFTLTGIPPGNYFLTAQFIGYEKKRINKITIEPANLNVDLGSIVIKPTAYSLKSLTVEGERLPITYQIDKKVIDVSKMNTAVSGNAADVLENVPSVSVDVEGNVSLRGSSSFTVLVDGRPSVLSNQEILKQIPASSIQTIEIVTNPSAKYDSEGTAGIINVVLKKNKNYGFNITANGNAGINDKYGGDFQFDNKSSLLNYSLGLNYRRWTLPGDMREEKRFYAADNISFANSNGRKETARNSFGLRGSLDFNLGEKDFLNLGGIYNTMDWLDNSRLNYMTSSGLNPVPANYLSKINSDGSGYFVAAYSNYRHKFSQPRHELAGEMFICYHDADEKTISSELDNIEQQHSGKNTTVSEPEGSLRVKLDYTLPLNDKVKLEAGSQGQIELSDSHNGLYEFNPANSNYEFQTKYSNNVKSRLSELALYSIYSHQWGNFGVQGGVRGEYTNIIIKVNSSSQKFGLNRWDYFPTFHTSYNFTEATQLTGSYTRRIQRPGDWMLEPFDLWISNTSVQRGNTALVPQFIDSYELGFKTLISGISISNELYYRKTNNKINFINSAYPGYNDVSVTTPVNVGNDYSLGAEYMFALDPFNFWNFTLMGKLYNYKIDGELDGISFAKNSFNWDIKANSIFNISKSTHLQLNIGYTSPTVSSQSRDEGFFSSDFAVKQDMLNRALSLTLQIRDIFKTVKREYSSEGIDLYYHSYFKKQAPVVMLNIRFNFSNFDNNDNNRQERPLDSGGFDE